MVFSLIVITETVSFANKIEVYYLCHLHLLILTEVHGTAANFPETIFRILGLEP